MKKTLYIFQNGELKRKDNSLYFETEQGKKYLPIEDINDIYLFGEVNVTKRFLEFISQKEICLHYFNHFGYYVGSYYPREHLNSGYMILKQVEHYLATEKREKIARAFIDGAIGQMIRVLKYYESRLSEAKDHLQVVEEQLLNDRDLLLGGDPVDKMMSIEGHAHEAYYQAFDHIIGQKQDFLFEKRSRRPPLNRMNALISFGNSICYTIVLSEIYKTYLDPRIGYLHSTNFRRFSLNLDIAEIFKPILVDRLIFSLINKHMITKKDFNAQTGGILLSEKGRRTFITEMDKRMRTTVNHRHLGKSVSYRRLIRLEIYKLQKHLMGEQNYSPYQALW